MPVESSGPYLQKILQCVGGLFLQIRSCFNLFAIGPSCGSDTSNIIRGLIFVQGGGVLNVVIQHLDIFSRSLVFWIALLAAAG